MPTVHELCIEGHTIVALGFNEELPGPPVIFLHGISSSVNFWVGGQTPIFTEKFRWYSLSLPGHYPAALPPNFRHDDLTPELITRVLAAAIRQLVGDQPVLLIGHSTGGFAGLGIAACAPDLVKAVVSISGFVEGKWYGALAPLQWLARRGPVGETLFRLYLKSFSLTPDLYRFAIRFYTHDPQAFFACPSTPPTLEKVFPDSVKLDARALIPYFKRMPDINIADWLPRITAPVLAITGDCDPIVPPEQARLIARCVPNGQLVEIKGAGHLPMAERWQEYTTIITDWMSGLALA